MAVILCVVAVGAFALSCKWAFEWPGYALAGIGIVALNVALWMGMN